MVQRTYYPATVPTEPELPGWEPVLADAHTLRHGYNLADLNRLTRRALWRSGLFLDFQTRYDLAWSAIAEYLYATVEPPHPVELIRVGQSAITTHLRSHMHDHGVDHHDPDKGMPRFAAYWEWAARNTPSPETWVVERTALWQIWPRLTPGHRRVLAALATHGTHQAAADALGMNRGSFNGAVSRARREFYGFWHEGEKPARVWGTDRRVGRLDAITPAKTKRRAPTRAVARRFGRPELELEHGRANTYSNHGCRCDPCTEAATAKARTDRRKRGIAPRRRITVSELAVIRSRQDAGETIAAIAADLQFSDSYVCRLLSGVRQPAPDPA